MYLQKILDDHRKWLETNGNKGVKADLRGVDLWRADLREVDLREADLRGADLREADLRGADLKGADLTNAALPSYKIIPEGDVIGYKKLSDGTICKLKIHSYVPRINAIGSRKCRSEMVLVLEGKGESGNPSGEGQILQYSPGDVVKCVEPFCDDVRIECASGIHWFITREEAEEY